MDLLLSQREVTSLLRCKCSRSQGAGGVSEVIGEDLECPQPGVQHGVHVGPSLPTFPAADRGGEAGPWPPRGPMIWELVCSGGASATGLSPLPTPPAHSPSSGC